MVTLRPGGRIESDRAEEHHWTIRHHAGQPYLVVGSADRTLWTLGQDGPNWCNHAAGVFLCPAPAEGFLLRHDPHELGIYADVACRNEYRLPERFETDDVIVDIGAHVGVFATECLKRGAGRVVCIEPNPENVPRLAHNLRPFGERATIWPCAAWIGERPTVVRLTTRPGAEHTGGGTVVDVADGVPVIGWPLDDILKSIAAPIRLVKLDCEGAEFPLLENSQEIWRASQIIGEWHLRWLWERYSLAWLVERFERAGYLVETNQTLPGELGHWWARRDDDSSVLANDRDPSPSD